MPDTGTYQEPLLDASRTELSNGAARPGQCQGPAPQHQNPLQCTQEALDLYPRGRQSPETIAPLSRSQSRNSLERWISGEASAVLLPLSGGINNRDRRLNPCCQELSAQREETQGRGTPLSSCSVEETGQAGAGSGERGAVSGSCLGQ